MTRVRFIAPPSGGLLVAGARVALANHAFARNRKGTFVLRAAAVFAEAHPLKFPVLPEN